MNKQIEIEVVYHALLQREPLSGELEFWTQFLEAGGTVEAMRADLKFTREYQTSAVVEAARQILFSGRSER